MENPYSTCHHCKGEMKHTLAESWCVSCGFISTMYESGWPYEGDEDDLRDIPPTQDMKPIEETIEETIKEMFEPNPFLTENIRMTIRIDDVSIGLSVKKREVWDDNSIADVLEEVVRMLRSPVLEDKEIF